MTKTYFITGIDTDAGKSYATGWLARLFEQQGLSVATQKFIQTGCTDSSEDIEVHRAIMGCGMLDYDLDHTSAPLIFTYPASAQLAAEIDGRDIDLSLIERSTERLGKRADVVLIEGAGGLAVPITDTYMAIDYVTDHRLPIVLVTNARLGSINHTVLSLEAIKSRGLELPYVIFNHHFDSSDERIAADTRAWVQRYLQRNFPATQVLDLPTISLS